ncbi:MAG TPA: formylglycine-generating enzyme family protein [Polyangiaceae bacterium]
MAPRAAALLWLAAVSPVAHGEALPPAVERLAALPVLTSGREGPVVALRAAGAAQVFIPAGSFAMGSDGPEIEYAIALCKKEPHGEKDCERYFARELEVHDVALSAYYIDRTEVTVAAYRRCVELGRCTAPTYAAGGQRLDRPEYPVTLVTWNDADAYCRFAGGRLPTEAEWERAARGRSGRRFPWGNLFNKGACNHGAAALQEHDDSDGYAELAPVGSFPLGRTRDGIDDMAGNVEEWVADAVDAFGTAHYPARSEVNPKGAPAGALRVVRGGSYVSSAAWLRGATRMFWPASERTPFRGFRCVHPVTEGA